MNQVVHFEIQSRDPAKLREFYSALFEWNIEPPRGEEQYSLITSPDGIRGGIMQAPTSHDCVTFYIKVEDIEAKLDEISAHGGSVIMPRTQIGEEKAIALFSDPQGNRIGIIETPYEGPGVG